MVLLGLVVAGALVVGPTVVWRVVSSARVSGLKAGFGTVQAWEVVASASRTGGRIPRVYSDTEQTTRGKQGMGRE